MSADCHDEDRHLGFWHTFLLFLVCIFIFRLPSSISRTPSFIVHLPSFVFFRLLPSIFCLSYSIGHYSSFVFSRPSLVSRFFSWSFASSVGLSLLNCCISSLIFHLPSSVAHLPASIFGFLIAVFRFFSWCLSLLYRPTRTFAQCRHTFTEFSIYFDVNSVNLGFSPSVDVLYRFITVYIGSSDFHSIVVPTIYLYLQSSSSLAGHWVSTLSASNHPTHRAFIFYRRPKVARRMSTIWNSTLKTYYYNFGHLYFIGRLYSVGSPNLFDIYICSMSIFTGYLYFVWSSIFIGEHIFYSVYIFIGWCALFLLVCLCFIRWCALFLLDGTCILCLFQITGYFSWHVTTFSRA